MKVGCLFLHLNTKSETTPGENFKDDNFFAPNAINSFKKYHPDVDIIYVDNNSLPDYLKKLNITEYYDSIGLFRVHLIKELLIQGFYSKIIMLGIDTFTCSYLDEFINNTTDDIICSSGPPYPFLKTEHWEPPIISFENYQDVAFINADVTCFNSVKGAESVYETSLQYWSDHHEQGGLNYCYSNQEKLGIKVSIVDFPYIKSNSLYNVRSKGIACGGNQMYKGNLYSGNYKDTNSRVIGSVYPTSTYYINDNKLYTNDHKQIKVFHYAEALGVKTKKEYENILNEIKTMWFNKETIEFLTNQCDCKF